jgi:hypothetical protein
MEWAPTVKIPVVRCALPEATATVPSRTAPFLNVTVPVAILGVIVAVNITGCSKTDGFTEAARLVVEVSLTPCVNAAVLALNLPSPP